jgi:hypothetical protein
LAVNHYPEIESMLRELADHTEQMSPDTSEARELRNTLVQLLAERPAPADPARPHPPARVSGGSLKSPGRRWRWPRVMPQRAPARIAPVEALCARVEAEVERAWELGQRLSDNGRLRQRQE